MKENYLAFKDFLQTFNPNLTPSQEFDFKAQFIPTFYTQIAEVYKYQIQQSVQQHDQPTPLIKQIIDKQLNQLEIQQDFVGLYFQGRTALSYFVEFFPNNEIPQFLLIEALLPTFIGSPDLPFTQANYFRTCTQTVLFQLVTLGNCAGFIQVARYLFEKLESYQINETVPDFTFYADNTINYQYLFFKSGSISAVMSKLALSIIQYQLKYFGFSIIMYLILSKQEVFLLNYNFIDIMKYTKVAKGLGDFITGANATFYAFFYLPDHLEVFDILYANEHQSYGMGQQNVIFLASILGCFNLEQYNSIIESFLQKQAKHLDCRMKSLIMHVMHNATTDAEDKIPMSIQKLIDFYSMTFNERDCNALNYMNYLDQNMYSRVLTSEIEHKDVKIRKQTKELELTVSQKQELMQRLGQEANKYFKRNQIDQLIQFLSSFQPVNFAAVFYQKLDIQQFTAGMASYLYGSWICAQAEPILSCYTKCCFEQGSQYFDSPFTGIELQSGPRCAQSIQLTINELQVDCVMYMQSYKNNMQQQLVAINEIIPGFLSGMCGAACGIRRIEEKYVKLYIRIDPIQRICTETQGVQVISQLFPLLIAATRLHYQLITLLSPYEGGKYYQRNGIVVSSLMCASSNSKEFNDDNALNQLIMAELGMIDHLGRPALTYAAVYGSSKIVQILKRYEALIQDKLGYNPQQAQLLYISYLVVIGDMTALYGLFPVLRVWH